MYERNLSPIFVLALGQVRGRGGVESVIGLELGNNKINSADSVLIKLNKPIGKKDTTSGNLIGKCIGTGEVHR
jgi:hypothetical protein